MPENTGVIELPANEGVVENRPRELMLAELIKIQRANLETRLNLRAGVFRQYFFHTCFKYEGILENQVLKLSDEQLKELVQYIIEKAGRKVRHKRLLMAALSPTIVGPIVMMICLSEAKQRNNRSSYFYDWVMLSFYKELKSAYGPDYCPIEKLRSA